MPDDTHRTNAPSLEHPVEAIRTYFIVFLLLLFFTAGNATESYFDLGSFNIVLVMAISTMKTALVAWFFMHLRHATRLTRLVILSGLVWLGILITFSMSDVVTRGWIGTMGH